MQRLLILLTMFCHTMAFAAPDISISPQSPPIIKLSIVSYDESLGSKIKRSTDGWRLWEEAGWKEYFDAYLNPDTAFRNRNAIPVCTVNDFNLNTYSRCMVGAMVHSMEKSMADLGTPAALTFSLAYSKYPNLDPDCTKNCIGNAPYQWQRSSAADIEVLLFPRSNGSQGHTYQQVKDGRVISTTALVAGAQQPFAILHLFRHEMAHALGFDGHLNDSELITLNRTRKAYPKCETRTFKPYPQSGLVKGCEHRTFVGGWNDKPACDPMSMGKSFFFNTRFNVPVYGEQFKFIFSCHLAGLQQSPAPTPPPAPAPQPPPPPAPAPVPTPTPVPDEYRQYCPTWKGLVARYCQ